MRLLTATALSFESLERISLRGWRANRQCIVNRPSLRFGLVLLRRVAQGAAPGGQESRPAVENW